ncbi:hypothetical protein SB725_33975, partial [Pseudomonas sp. SIMBA_041]|uniref:hypothetical protein n=1 Tax=Pseudomonas sp. SIMBA_041 TaxID=3085782 RepID=UPI0039799909
CNRTVGKSIPHLPPRNVVQPRQMSSTSFGNEPATTEIVLKTIAPRAPLHLLTRSRLSAVGPSFNDQPIVLVQAPAG